MADEKKKANEEDPDAGLDEAFESSIQKGTCGTWGTDIRKKLSK